nr:MAG TPA: hypothetical protein [Caudoviricetes sp.]
MEKRYENFWLSLQYGRRWRHLCRSPNFNIRNIQ